MIFQQLYIIYGKTFNPKIQPKNPPVSEAINEYATYFMAIANLE